MAKQRVNSNQIKSTVAFFVRATAVQSVSAGVFAKMTGITTKIYDYGSNFNTSNQRFVAPVSGVYSFKAMTGIANDSIRHFASIYINGTEHARSSNGDFTGNSNTSQVVYEGYLAAGDYVELYAWRANAGNMRHDSITGNGSLWMSGHLIGEV